MTTNRLFGVVADVYLVAVGDTDSRKSADCFESRLCAVTFQFVSFNGVGIDASGIYAFGTGSGHGCP